MTVDVRNLAHEALALVEGQIRSREAEVEVRVEGPENMEEIETDPAKLKQVIVNLVGNALKFTESGEIVVRIEVDEGTGQPTTLSVIDTGIRIPKARLGPSSRPFNRRKQGQHASSVAPASASRSRDLAIDVRPDGVRSHGRE